MSENAVFRTFEAHGTLPELANAFSNRFHLCHFCTVCFVDLSQLELGISTKISFNFCQSLTLRASKPLKPPLLQVELNNAKPNFSQKHIAGLFFTYKSVFLKTMPYL